MNEIIKILQDLKNTSHGQALRKYLDVRIAELNEIEKIQGEVQLEAHKAAKKIVKEIFNFLDVDNPSVVEKKRSQYT